MIDIIREAWGWIGLEPAEVIATNDFGNVIVRAKDGAYWRICPEEWLCDKVAENEHQFKELFAGDDLRTDWEMSQLVRLARQALGDISPEQCYCLKIPGVIGGKYEAANLGTISRIELIRFSGDMAQQIKDVPDGTAIRIKIV